MAFFCGECYRAMDRRPLIACRHCDLLQREAPLPEGGVARCRRCEAELFRSHPQSVERTLAFTLAGAVLFAIANSFPIVELEVQGVHHASTLIGAVRSLWDQDRLLVASLVFATTILFPALELAAMIYLLAPLRRGRVAAGVPQLLRVLQAVRPWGMVEVFMLGVLVSLVKLAHVARVEPGVSLWAFAGVMLLLAAAAASFDAREVWVRVRVGR